MDVPANNSTILGISHGMDPLDMPRGASSPIEKFLAEEAAGSAAGHLFFGQKTLAVVNV